MEWTWLCPLLAIRLQTNLPNSPSAKPLQVTGNVHRITGLMEMLQGRLGSTWVEHPAQA